MSLPRYPEYRDSGVEWLWQVPAHWEVRRLKHLCNVLPSNVDKKTHAGQSSVRLCNYTDVYYNETIVQKLPFMSASASSEQIEKFELRAGDTIITKDSESADDIAISAYVPDDLPGVICGYHLAIVRPVKGVDGRFVKRLFDAHYLKARFAVLANGLTRVGLSQAALSNVVVPVPPIQEQMALAELLDRETAKIDALIAEQEKLIALLAEKRQATISHAVTRGLNPDVPMRDSGVAWLGKVPAHWRVIPIKRTIVSIEQGWSPQCENFPVEQPEDWGVMKVGCVNGGVFRPEENKKLPAELEPVQSYGLKQDDLLVSRANTRDLVGSAAVVPSDFPRLLLCDKLYRLRLQQTACLPEFLTAYLGTALVRSRIELEATGASSSMLNIGQSVILELPVCLPPADEQRELVVHIRAKCKVIDALRSTAHAAISLLKERRAAVIAAAVTGQIDVRQAADDATAEPRAA